MKYSYRAIDVGFSLPRQKIWLELPADITAAEYDGPDGEPRAATGTIEEIARELEAAGYLVNE